jgi:hypothetical protein
MSCSHFSLGETQSEINTFARGFYFRLGRHNILIRNRSRRSQKRMAEAAHFVGGSFILIGKGGRRAAGSPITVRS